MEVVRLVEETVLKTATGKTVGGSSPSASANFIRQRCGSIPLPRFGGESSKWLGYCLANFMRRDTGDTPEHFDAA